jgi:hypothetical protein
VTTIVSPTDPVSLAFYQAPAITPAQSLDDNRDQERFTARREKDKDKDKQDLVQCTR